MKQKYPLMFYRQNILHNVSKSGITDSSESVKVLYKVLILEKEHTNSSEKC